MEEWSSSMTSWLVNTVYAGGSLVAGAVFLLYMYQDKLLYIPDMPHRSLKENPEGYRHPGEIGVEYDDLKIPTADGTKIHAWLLKQPDHTAQPTLLFFHGNAGNIGFRLPNAMLLYRHLRCNILLVEYRGFGDSQGTPTEHGLKLDAEAALEYMIQRKDMDKSKLVLYGRSLGGAVAAHLASVAHDKVAGVILENTFRSISSMVDSLMPFLRYVKPLVLRIGWNTEAAVPHLPQPMLFLSGALDEIVPPTHMDKLYALAKNRPGHPLTQWHRVANGTHNDTWLRGKKPYLESISSFLDAIQASSTSPTCPETEYVASEGHHIPTTHKQPLLNPFHQIKSTKTE